MAGLQPTLSDPYFENWVKSGLSLQYTKDGIENFVDNVLGNLQKVILFPLGVSCTSCTTENVIKCERNNNFCKFAGKACQMHDPKSINKCYRPCPSNVCDKIRDEIIANHRYSKPAWQNTDARQWCTNRWKIAVCYMSSGYSQQTSASDTDLPGVLSVIINNTYFQTYVADKLSDDNNVFRQARTSRNEILHNPRQRLTDVDLRAHIATFTAVLSDTKSLSTDANAITALTNLQQIVNNTISITAQHAGQILAKAFISIQGAVDDVNDLKEDTIKVIVDKMKEIDKVSDEALTFKKEAVKSITDTKDKALDALKAKNDEIVENIKKKGEEVLTPIKNAKDKALDALKGTHEEVAENIKKTGDAALKPIADATNKALDAIKVKNDNITENIQKTGEEALKPIADAKDNALDEIEKRALERIAREEEKSLGAIEKKIAEKSKQLTIEHTETLVEKKTELVTEISNIINKDRPQGQSYLLSITELRRSFDKSNKKSMFFDDVSLQSYDNSLLEVRELEKLWVDNVKEENITQRLIFQSKNTILTLVLSSSVFENVGILQSTRCLTRVHLEDIHLSHVDKLALMSYVSQAHRMKEIEIDYVKCDDCVDDKCSPVLDLSQHDQLEGLWLRRINVAITTMVNVSNTVKCELWGIEPAMSFVNVTNSLHNAPKLKGLELGGTRTQAEAAAILECIGHQKHLERLLLWNTDFGINGELVLSQENKDIKYIKLHGVTMTKLSFRGLIDSILTCNQVVYVEVCRLHLKPVENIQDILDNVRQHSRCTVMRDRKQKEEIIRFDFKTKTRQQT